MTDAVSSWTIQSTALLASSPMVVGANHYEFAPDQTMTNLWIESRALVWGDSGVGHIETGGLTIELTPGRFVFLPWRHDIVYNADAHNPFRVGTIHVIPWHDPSVALELHVAQGRTDRLAGVPYRRDVDWPELRGIVQGRAQPGARLLTVADLTIDHMQQGRPDPSSLQALGVLLLNELRVTLHSPALRHYDIAPGLTRMQEFIASHLQIRLTIAQIAAAGNVSESTAERLFHRYEGQSVARWVNARRMTVARELLQTTSLPIADVARAVGLEDASYFSRIFRRAFGVPPSSYAFRSRPVVAEERA